MANINLLILTDTAAQHIKKMIAEDPTKPYFRLSVRQTGCSGWMYCPEMVATSQQDDLHCVDHGIDLYLAVDAQKMVAGCKIDYIDKGLMQTQLVFDNPNVDHLCGCGESFHFQKTED